MSKHVIISPEEAADSARDPGACGGLRTSARIVVMQRVKWLSSTPDTHFVVYFFFFCT